jgi:hypothetical protein
LAVRGTGRPLSLLEKRRRGPKGIPGEPASGEKSVIEKKAVLADFLIPFLTSIDFYCIWRFSPVATLRNHSAQQPTPRLLVQSGYYVNQPHPNRFSL